MPRLNVRIASRASETSSPVQFDNDQASSIVIPPAPAITKRSASAIVIPANLAAKKSDVASKFDDRPAVASTPNVESKYDEHPAVATKANAESKYDEHPALATKPDESSKLEEPSGVSVGSNFGYRRDPFTRRAKFHAGVDLKARWGDAVGASQAGTVVFAGWHHGYGNMVIVEHGGGVTTHYAHLSSFDVEPGAHVERGTIIGRAGSTGRATSPHLHYEVRIDGAAMDPFQPLALDPSSNYFKQTRPTVETGHGDPTATGSLQNK